nr:MAG TPA: hypothetical protein [Caudoviricetes sp.]
MTKRNLCDTCLHCHVCRHSTDPAGTAMVSCTHYVCRVLVDGPIELVPVPTREEDEA